MAGVITITLCSWARHFTKTLLMLLSTQLYKWEALNLILRAQGGEGGVLGISSDGDDRMELKVKTQKNP